MNDKSQVLLQSDAIQLALAQASEAYNVAEGVSVKRLDDTLWIAFPGTAGLEDMVVDSDFSYCSMASIWRDLEEAANEMGGYNLDIDRATGRVHKGFARRFKEVLAMVVKDRRLAGVTRIICTGHSLGGAVAALTTLWLLSVLRDTKPLCITFGMPLIGDVDLAKFVTCQNWDNQFYHLVSRHDIVPRVLLAPVRSIRKNIKALLPFWKGNDKAKAKDPVYQQAAAQLLETVKKCIQVASNIFHGLTGNQSAYRPMGLYVICTKSGAALIDNPVTTLQMLHLTMEGDGSLDAKRNACIIEHLLCHYEGLPGWVPEGPVDYASIGVSDTRNVPELGTLLQLSHLGFQLNTLHGAMAGSALEASRNRQAEMAARSCGRNAEYGKVQEAMAELEWFKLECEKNNQHYYEVYKSFNSESCLKANINRIRLANFWDETVEMCSNNLLPPEFKWSNKWVNTGRAYCLLVEPLDIANYYRLGKNEESGHYRRPRRYKALESWKVEQDLRKGRQQKPRKSDPSLTQNSMFWALVEEAEDRKGEKLKEFREKLNDMRAAKDVSAADLSLLSKRCDAVKLEEVSSS